MKNLKKVLAAIAVLASCLVSLNAEVLFPSTEQPAEAALKDGALQNNVISAKISPRSGKISIRASGKEIAKSDGPLFTLVLGNGEKIASSQMSCAPGKSASLKGDPAAFRLSERVPGKAVSAKFTTKDGNITVVWSAILRDGSSYIRQEFSISAKNDVAMTSIVALDVELAGSPKVNGNTRGSLITSENAFAALETPMGINEVSGKKVSGTWSRKTTLKKGETWNISSVVGVLVPGQERRSFLAYHERERAMPWRSFVHYNSWYELNINRNNNIANRMKEADCLAVVNAWNDKLFKKHKIGIDAFVWDDGWDDFNSLWGFYKPAFPNGFKKLDSAVRKQKAGTGAWLGPVGGYGGSKAQRLGFWNRNHPNNQIGNFQLSNKEYFDAFVGRCGQMVDDYDMRYFKFDGISAIPHAKGPGNEEDAEGIIKVLNALRQKRGDLFFNCTVGTWASPFWFRFADSVWRQEGDHGETGLGHKRDKWITYRDRLVHEVFVTGAPLMPINSLMTHGLMVTKFGPPAGMPRDIESIKKEMRCAFACGSALQELYVDNDLMTSLGKNEELWKELAECIKWFRGNADVLDDSHWVGGNPWNGSDGAIYGWASWNRKKCTLALRNSSDKAKSFKTTLRAALDVPAFVKGKITLKNSFADQPALAGITGASIDLDKEISFNLEPFAVFVFDGVPAK